MIQFYAKPEHIQGNRLELHDNEAHHAKNVLRLKPGDQFWATDGLGKRYRVQASAIDRKQIVGEIQGQEEQPARAPDVVLVFSPTKQRARLETAIEKSVELGVDKIVLLQSERTERSKIRIDRLETIITTAMKQSLRLWKPELIQMESWSDLMDQFGESTLWMAHEAIADQQQAGLQKEHIDAYRTSKQIVLLVGPEGGFSEREVERAQENGAQLISLGSHRLRAETAAIAFLSLLIPLQ